MKDESKQMIEQRANNLLCLARALYQAGVNEQDPKRLDMLRLVAAELKEVVDEAVNSDGTLHPDLGLDLLLFLELKSDGIDGGYKDRVATMLNSLDHGA